LGHVSRRSFRGPAGFEGRYAKNWKTGSKLRIHKKKGWNREENLKCRKVSKNLNHKEEAGQGGGENKFFFFLGKKISTGKPKGAGEGGFVVLG